MYDIHVHIYILTITYVYYRDNDFNTEMIGESKPYLLNNDEISSINKLGQPILSNNIATSYYKAKIRGKIFTSMKYTRQKRQNNHTIAFSNTAIYNGYGKIELFMCAGNAKIASVKKFIMQQGIPHNLPEEVITMETQKLLFEDYFTCTDECTVYIFCITLSVSALIFQQT